MGEAPVGIAEFLTGHSKLTVKDHTALRRLLADRLQFPNRCGLIGLRLVANTSTALGGLRSCCLLFISQTLTLISILLTNCGSLRGR